MPSACASCGEPFLKLATPGGRAAQAARLTARMPDGTVTEYVLETNRTSLGRHPANTIRLADREVSKEHASIEVAAGTFLLRDLNSSNGTFVNGRRVRELRLKDGDEIALGSTCRLIFHGGTAVTPGVPANVTVVTGNHSVPAFVAQLDQREEDEFRPVGELTNIEALRQDYEKLRIAHEFHRQVGLERDPRNLAEKILTVASQLVAAEHGVLFLSPDGEKLEIVADWHRKPNAEVEVLVSETVLSKVKDTRQAVLTKDAILDSRFSSSESIVAQGIRSAMAVPLLAKGALKGVLFLDSRARSNAFSEKDLKILSGIASQAAIALENAELARKIEHEAVTRAELSRFLSKAVAEAVIKGEVELLRVGRLAEVTVLFADIRGFTTLAESESPQETVAMLNQFFTAMADCVFRHSGNLDKFIGDCVMAVWGPPKPNPDDSARALRAALEMQREVDALNDRRAQEGKAPIEVGIGVNTGQAVVGYMGSSERHEFTAIGDSVNVAARLCGAAKGGEVLATETTVRRAGVGFEIEHLPVMQVKGKEKGVVTFRVLGLEETSARRSR
jgi:adenylate cyclase